MKTPAVPTGGLKILNWIEAVRVPEVKVTLVPGTANAGTEGVANAPRSIVRMLSSNGPPPMTAISTAAFGRNLIGLTGWGVGRGGGIGVGVG